jgi:hypothetical protein
VPVARGGASTTANLRVTCRFHNQRAARQAFGDATPTPTPTSTSTPTATATATGVDPPAAYAAPSSRRTTSVTSWLCTGFTR